MLNHVIAMNNPGCWLAVTVGRIRDPSLVESSLFSMVSSCYTAMHQLKQKNTPLIPQQKSNNDF